MPDCECGCKETATGDFIPGHDQKLRAALERRVGGILGLRELVEAAEAHQRGDSTAEELGQAVRRVLWRSQRS